MKSKWGRSTRVVGMLSLILASGASRAETVPTPTLETMCTSSGSQTQAWLQGWPIHLQVALREGQVSILEQELELKWKDSTSTELHEKTKFQGNLDLTSSGLVATLWPTSSTSKVISLELHLSGYSEGASIADFGSEKLKMTCWSEFFPYNWGRDVNSHYPTLHYILNSQDPSQTGNGFEIVSSEYDLLSEGYVMTDSQLRYGEYIQDVKKSDEYTQTFSLNNTYKSKLGTLVSLKAEGAIRIIGRTRRIEQINYTLPL